MPEPRLHVAINGARDHPGIPRTPIALAAAARAAVAAGAQVVHFHAYGPEGTESFDPAVCGVALRAVRSACPGIPISLTTSATIDLGTANCAGVLSMNGSTDYVEFQVYCGVGSGTSSTNGGSLRNFGGGWKVADL